jgi:hypothetical protein
MADYQNVSSRPEYSDLINRSYRSRDVMLIHGVTRDRNYKKVVDLYALTPRPGFGGSEVLSRDELPVGTTIRVLKVLECTNCIFGDSDQLEVELPDLEKYAARPTHVYFSFAGVGILLQKSGRAYMNPLLFEPIGRPDATSQIAPPVGFSAVASAHSATAGR